MYITTNPATINLLAPKNPTQSTSNDGTPIQTTVVVPDWLVVVSSFLASRCGQRSHTLRKSRRAAGLRCHDVPDQNEIVLVLQHIKSGLDIRWHPCVEVRSVVPLYDEFVHGMRFEDVCTRGDVMKFFQNRCFGDEEVIETHEAGVSSVDQKQNGGVRTCPSKPRLKFRLFFRR